jgi:hypothetical protein
MYEQTEFNERWGRRARLQREVWEGWTKALEAYKSMSPWEQARHTTLEVGVDLLKRLVNMQADLLKAAIGAGGAGADLPRLAGQYLETLQGASDGWLELQRRSSRLWFESMARWTRPVTSAPMP